MKDLSTKKDKSFRWNEVIQEMHCKKQTNKMPDVEVQEGINCYYVIYDGIARHQRKEQLTASERPMKEDEIINNAMAKKILLSEQKHAEEIAALRAEHRAEMARLCDTFMRNANFLEDGDYEQLRERIELIKQRISDE